MRLFKSAFTVSFFIALSRILGFVRDVLIAKYLGVGMLSDAFFAAFKLPNFFRRVFAEGAFNSAFVPIFVDKLQHKNPASAKRFLRNILSLLFFALLIFVILFQILMPFAVKAMFFGFSADVEKFSLLVNLSRITIFYLLFISIVSLFSGVLNSLGKFAAPSSVPIILNGTLIASVFIFAPITPNLAYALSWGVFVAGILQMLWLWFCLSRAKMLVFPSFSLVINQDTKKFFSKLLPGIIGANVMQINLLVNTMIASLIPGAVSYLYYSDRINQLPLAMIGIAINIALLPTLSKAIKSKDTSRAMLLQNLAMEASLILVIPAAMALIFLSTPIIETLFQRGAFGSKETAFVAKALMFYAFGLPAFVLVKIIEPGFFARGNTKTPMKIALFCVLVNVILTLLFLAPLGYVGIILASVLASYLNAFLMLHILRKNQHFVFEPNFFKKLIRIIIPALIMSAGLIVLNQYFSNLHAILNLGLTISAGIIIYFTCAYFLGIFNILKEVKKHAI